MAAKVNWNADQGATLNKTIYRVRTSMGAPVDLTTYTGSLCFIRKNYAANTPIASFDVTLTANGEVIVAADQSTMAGIKAGRYVYDVTATLGSTATRLVEGYVSVDPAATLGPPPPDVTFDLEKNIGDSVNVVSGVDEDVVFFGSVVANVANVVSVQLDPFYMYAAAGDALNIYGDLNGFFLGTLECISNPVVPGRAAVELPDTKAIVSDGQIITIGPTTYTLTVVGNQITAIAVTP